MRPYPHHSTPSPPSPSPLRSCSPRSSGTRFHYSHAPCRAQRPPIKRDLHLVRWPRHSSLAHHAGDSCRVLECVNGVIVCACLGLWGGGSLRGRGTEIGSEMRYPMSIFDGNISAVNRKKVKLSSFLRPCETRGGVQESESHGRILEDFALTLLKYRVNFINHFFCQTAIQHHQAS